MKLKRLFICCLCLFSINAFTQPQRGVSSVKVNFGTSFNETLKQNDDLIQKGNVAIWSPEILRLFKINKKTVIETGLKLYNSGGRIEYHLTQLNVSSSIISRTSILNIPVNFMYAPLNTTDRLYLFSGLIFGYVPQATTFYNMDPTASITTTHFKGLKYFINFGIRQYFQIDKRQFALDLTYTHGLSPLFNTETTNINSSLINKYSNNGSNLCLGICLYFNRHIKPLHND